MVALEITHIRQPGTVFFHPVIVAFLAGEVVPQEDSPLEFWLGVPVVKEEGGAITHIVVDTVFSPSAVLGCLTPEAVPLLDELGGASL